MSTVLLETRREVKWIHWKKCVKLVINKKNSPDFLSGKDWKDAEVTEDQIL